MYEDDEYLTQFMKNNLSLESWKSGHWKIHAIWKIHDTQKNHK
jgi:hypothetical protein